MVNSPRMSETNWEERYQTGDMPWEKGEPSPGLVDFLAAHPELPRGERVNIGRSGPMSAVLFGPSSVADGTMNLIGALRRSMATTGYTDLKEFQRVELIVEH